MKKLTEKDFADAAKVLDCDVAAIKAVAQVESAGSGFLTNGEPKILFEAHWFYKFTGGRFGFSNVSQKYWRLARPFYRQNQHSRLAKAVKLDRNSALKSCSWGKFQIMGFNYKACGFRTIQQFVNAMYAGEREQLLAFCNFIKHRRLDDELREKNWAKFAYGYNGKGYKTNRYDKKMKNAYEKFKR